MLAIKAGIETDRYPPPPRIFDSPDRDERGWIVSAAHVVALPHARGGRAHRVVRPGRPPMRDSAPANDFSSTTRRCWPTRYTSCANATSAARTPTAAGRAVHPQRAASPARGGAGRAAAARHLQPPDARPPRRGVERRRVADPTVRWATRPGLPPPCPARPLPLGGTPDAAAPRATEGDVQSAAAVADDRGLHEHPAQISPHDFSEGGRLPEATKPVSGTKRRVEA